MPKVTYRTKARRNTREVDSFVSQVCSLGIDAELILLSSTEGQRGIRYTGEIPVPPALDGVKSININLRGSFPLKGNFRDVVTWADGRPIGEGFGARNGVLETSSPVLGNERAHKVTLLVQSYGDKSVSASLVKSDVPFEVNAGCDLLSRFSKAFGFDTTFRVIEGRIDAPVTSGIRFTRGRCGIYEIAGTVTRKLTEIWEDLEQTLTTGKAEASWTLFFGSGVSGSKADQYQAWQDLCAAKLPVKTCQLELTYELIDTIALEQLRAIARGKAEFKTDLLSIPGRKGEIAVLKASTNSEGHLLELTQKSDDDYLIDLLNTRLEDGFKFQR